MRLDSSLIFSLSGVLVSLGGLCAGFGILKGKAEHAIGENRAQAERLKTRAAKEDAARVIKQADDDRRHNANRHGKIFDPVSSRAKETGALNAMPKAVKKSLDELKNKIRDGLKEIRDELKELRRV
jgi:hypothetical protein